MPLADLIGNMVRLGLIVEGAETVFFSQARNTGRMEVSANGILLFWLDEFGKAAFHSAEVFRDNGANGPKKRS